jgi:hypothetical protein
MAGQAGNRASNSVAQRSKKLTLAQQRTKKLQETVARLYGRGYSRAQVARLLTEQLAPETNGRNAEIRRKVATKLLRDWERQVQFRDLLYLEAVKELDLDSPAILRGIAAKARRGRVDAARLALELTGRHNPRGEVQPAQVAVVFNGIPRPELAQAVGANNPEAIELADEDIMDEPDDEV